MKKCDPRKIIGPILAFLSGCTVASSALVEVQDPEGVAGLASELAFEVRSLDGELIQESRRDMDGEFPITITVAGPESRSLEVSATVFDGSGRPIARGHVVTELTDTTTPATLELGPSCETTCDDGLFCNGEERCERGVCLRSPAPCQANFECVLSTCVEASDECSVTVDHAVCDSGDGISRYCSPSSGCVAGSPCTADSECHDGSVCNGEERCIDFNCAGGAPPNPDDGSPCTVDGCNDANEDTPLFSIQDPTKDGNACDLPNEAGVGICLSTAVDICVESRCGDGFLDPFREPCDDGNDENTDACIKLLNDTGEFVCASARCGDGFVQQGVEICDDNNTASGDGCRGDCGKLEVCGDGELDQGEACDDGNANPNDGCHQCQKTKWSARVLTGFGESGGDPLSTSFSPSAIAIDRNGNLFVADSANHRVWRFDKATGLPSVAAGTGTSGFSGDGGPATAAQLYSPSGLVVDGLGNLWIADLDHRIRQVCAGDTGCPAGTIRTVAGNGAFGFSGDGGPATAAQLSSPIGIAVDGLGNLWIADRDNHRIRQVCAGDTDCPAGTIRTVAGNGAFGFSGDGGPATAAQLDYLRGIAVDGLGNLWIADNGRIRQVCAGDSDCPVGTIRTVAGTGTLGFSGDGGPATDAQIDFPSGITFDGRGNLLIADRGNNRIRQICAENSDCPVGTIRTIAGTGAFGTSGDGGPATAARFAIPFDVAADNFGNVFIADFYNRRIRQVCAGDDGCPAGTIQTIAGAGLNRFSGNGRTVTAAELTNPGGLAVDGLGHVLVAERGVLRVPSGISDGHRIRRICSGGSECPAGSSIQTLAGTGTSGFSGDGGAAATARLDNPSDVAVDGHRNVFVADRDNHRIRQVCAGDAECPAGNIRTVAGIGDYGFSGDEGPATAAELRSPHGIAVDGLGNLFIADSGNDRIRQVCAGDAECLAGTIRTIAGTGISGFSGDGGPATAAELDHPTHVAVDSLGNLFITDSSNHRIRQVCVGDAQCPAGTIKTVAGNGESSYENGTWVSFSGDGGPATDARLWKPSGLAVDFLGNVFIADTGNHRIRQVCDGDVDCPAGTIRTIAGTGAYGFSGDGGPATAAALSQPSGIAVDHLGNLWIADTHNKGIRQVCAGDADCPAGTIRTVAGYVDPSDGLLGLSALGEPFALTAMNNQWLVADGVSGRVRLLDVVGDALTTVTGYPEGFALDGALARYSRLLLRPRGIAFDPLGERFFVSESEGHTIRVVDTSSEPWTIDTYAGTGTPSFIDGVGTEAAFSAPSGMVFDTVMNRLLVVDRDNHIIRAIDAGTGQTSTLVGTPRTRGFAGDGGLAQDALLNAPEAIALGTDGSIYIADTGNNRIRRLEPGGHIDTVLGDGVRASSGEGSPAGFFPVDRPLGLTLDSFGNLFVASSTALRRVSAGDDGIATGDDAVSTIYGTAPREVFPASITNCLSGLAVTEDDDGTPEARLIVLDACVGYAIALDRRLEF